MLLLFVLCPLAVLHVAICSLLATCIYMIENSLSIAPYMNANHWRLLYYYDNIIYEMLSHIIPHTGFKSIKHLLASNLSFILGSSCKRKLQSKNVVSELKPHCSTGCILVCSDFLKCKHGTHVHVWINSYICIVHAFMFPSPYFITICHRLLHACNVTYHI